MKQYSELLKMDPAELNSWLLENFSYMIPENIDDIEAMKEAGEMLGKIANSYSYIIAMLSFAKVAVRNEKRKGKENKDQAEDMIDRKESLQNMADILKMQYQAISRMITVRKDINEELKMMNCL